MFTETVTYPAAFFAGLLTFFSPCILPLIPAYFSFITGFSLDELIQGDEAHMRRKVIQSTLVYVAGFSFVFILLGASASFLGSLVLEYSDTIRIIGGILVIVFGMHLLGFFRISVLDFEKRIHLQKKPLHLFGTFFIGMAFAAGWSPCVGPLLGSILVIASTKESIMAGIYLLAVYSLGLAMPFLLISVFINYILDILKKSKNMMQYIHMASGVLLILIGVMLLFNRMSLLSQI